MAFRSRQRTEAEQAPEGLSESPTATPGPGLYPDTEHAPGGSPTADKGKIPPSTKPEGLVTSGRGKLVLNVYTCSCTASAGKALNATPKHITSLSPF